MQVFLSYARSTDREHARAVFEALGGNTDELAFLDTEHIEALEEFPQRLIDSLLQSRVVVVFASPTYFKRWYCVQELRAAIAPFTHLAARPGATQEERRQALELVVVVLPASGELDLWNLPPKLHPPNWCSADDTNGIATAVRAQLAKNLPTLGERIDKTIGLERFRREWLHVSRLPAADQIPSSIPFAPLQGVPKSMHQGFVGRADELWRIHSALTSLSGSSGMTAFPTVALSGGAGFGKSQLAVEYLHRFGTRYFSGGLFWIDAEHDGPPQHYQIIRALNPATPDWRTLQGEPGRVAERLIQEFRSLQKPALVIIDNLPEAGSDSPPPGLDEVFPAVGWVTTLVTSRRQVSLSEPSGIISLAVDVLEPEDALTLLTNGPHGTDIGVDGWREIAEWVGRLPLSLRLLNRALAARALTAHDLLERTHFTGTTELLDRAMQSLQASIRPGTLRGVTEALMMSYERLPDTAKRAARLLAWLAPAPIPEAIIESLSDQFDPETRTVLVMRSIVTDTVRAEVPVYGAMHAVLADFLREQTVEHFEELTTLTKALMSTMRRNRIDTPGMWPTMDACEPHALALWTHVAQMEPRPVFVQHTAGIGLLLVSLAMTQGRGQRAADLALGILPALAIEDEHGNRGVPAGDPNIGAFAEVLAPALALGGEREVAIEMQRYYLSYLEQSEQEDDPTFLANSDNLALWLSERGHPEDLEEAGAIYARTVPAWRERNPREIDTLTALNSWALLEWRRGNTALAKALFEEAMGGFQHVGTMRTERVKTQMNLGELISSEDPERADALFSDALNAAEQIKLPDRYPQKRRLLYHCALGARRRNDNNEAAALLARALAGYAADRGAYDPETSDVAWDLLVTQLTAGALVAASETRATYLGWLLMASEEDLTPRQRGMRKALMDAGGQTSG